MKVVGTVRELARLREDWARPLGLVPTMGYLHAGHMALVDRARRENGTAAASIFVNPAQFGPREDLAAYPRDLPRDLRMLEEHGCDVVFAPSADEVYPSGFDTYVEPGRVSRPLEGGARPGHFRGVATVVTKLFMLFRPDRAYFGQKDGQQVAVIKRVNADLNLGVEIVVVPTMREVDGLAMSSRNVYLGPYERRAAPALYRGLCAARELWRSGERDGAKLRAAVERVVAGEELVKLEYVSVNDAESMEEVERVEGRAMISLAARVGKARLIDNVVLGE